MTGDQGSNRRSVSTSDGAQPGPTASGRPAWLGPFLIAWGVLFIAGAIFIALGAFDFSTEMADPPPNIHIALLFGVQGAGGIIAGLVMTFRRLRGEPDRAPLDERDVVAATGPRHGD
jgi:hypothetical protein